MRIQSGQDDAESLIAEITVDAYDEDEQLWAFRQAFEDNISWPFDAFVIGEPVCVLGIDYGGNARRGLTGRCRREDGSEHEIAASEIHFLEGSEAGRHGAAYRQWLGIEPVLERGSAASQSRKRHKVAREELDLDRPIELVTLAVMQASLRGLLLGSEREVTLRARSAWKAIPGEIVTVRARKQWRFSGHPYLSGEIENVRLDASSLGLTPLYLTSLGDWDPAGEYWGEEGEPSFAWARPILARGPRPQFEMEQILPGSDPADPFEDPILKAVEFHQVGDFERAHEVLADLARADLRCLDAHAHMGNFVFDRRPEEALRHYEVGVRIGELSFDSSFEGVLHWGLIDNRPFLRCLSGYGLCLWRLGRLKEAGEVFERMLLLNPGDNQGARFVLEALQKGESWEPDL